jgi:hypothetical protein
VTSLLPLLKARKHIVASDLRADGRVGGAPQTSRLYGALVGAQISLAVALTTGCFLLAAGLYRLSTMDTGLEPRHRWIATVLLPADPYSDPAHGLAATGQILEAVATIPGVVEVAATTAPPTTVGDTSSFTVPGTDLKIRAAMDRVSRDYFSSIGLSFRSGAPWPAQGAAAGTAVVNADFARLAFGDESAVNRVVVAGREGHRTIVGVVDNVRLPGSEGSAPRVYFPLDDRTGRRFSVVVRASADLPDIGSSIRAAVSRADSDVAVVDTARLSTLIAQRLKVERVATGLATGFAIVALIIAAAGVYGLSVYIAARRQREIGIRLALGADRSAVMAQALVGTLKLVGTSVVIGLFVAWTATKWLRSVIDGLSAFDPGPISAAALVVLIMMLLASAPSIWKAARANPSAILRSE